MKLSRTILYALQATLQLAEAGQESPVPCSRLAATGRMPERFLLQILRNLVTHGILNSTRGVEGGYSLQRPAEAISLLDLIEAIDGPISGTCPRDDGLAPESLEKLQSAMNQINLHLRQELGAIRLTHLLARQNTPIAQ